MLVANMHNSKIPDNPPTGASEDSFTQTAVIIISMVMMSAAVVLVLPDNPPTGANEDSFTQTAVVIISMVMMSAAVVLVFPLSKRKRKR
ncbi:cna protein B-type domain [[Eubacterium] siraeum CAG:80]|uniref:Cna protein B-type domain n=1 Tax=[Eubacterium] siraeum CAG:80 TaxID=1263080 RepID=R6RNU5_9FIRM|nr:cna protein B-type domain [[Eubacterium] siraeum CAG:80]